MYANNNCSNEFIRIILTYGIGKELVNKYPEINVKIISLINNKELELTEATELIEAFNRLGIDIVDNKLIFDKRNIVFNERFQGTVFTAINDNTFISELMDLHSKYQGQLDFNKKLIDCRIEEEKAIVESCGHQFKLYKEEVKSYKEERKVLIAENGLLLIKLTGIEEVLELRDEVLETGEIEL